MGEETVFFVPLHPDGIWKPSSRSLLTLSKVFVKDSKWTVLPCLLPGGQALGTPPPLWVPFFGTCPSPFVRPAGLQDEMMELIHMEATIWLL